MGQNAPATRIKAMRTSSLQTGTQLAIYSKTPTLKPLTPFTRTLENSQVAIHQKLKRILKLDEQNSWTAKPGDNGSMITKIIIRPNPFVTSIAFEIDCINSKNLIIRMTDEQERIVKMFSWFVVKGANVTTFNEMETLSAGTYCLDVMDLEGELLFSTEVVKK